MMRERMIEIAVGVFVAAGLAALLMLAVRVGNLALGGDSGVYRVTARFDEIGGLKVRAPVSMAGIRIGQVVALEFDPESFEAVATLEIEDRFDRVPADSSAGIFTAGILGERYVSIGPGADEEYLEEGDEIELTSSAMVLERLIGQFLFDRATEGGDER